MAKIYVSSTYLDLKDCREQARVMLHRMGHEVVGMEYYTAEQRPSVEKCLADVASCDLYLGLFAWRYGWVPETNNPEKLSITEMEYRQALATGRALRVFLLDGKAPWPGDFFDDDRTQIKRLRKELSEKHAPGFFNSDKDVVDTVAPTIYNWAKERGHIPATVATIPEHNLTAYFAALRKRYGVLALEGLTPPQKEEYLQIQLRQVFVEQNVRENPPPVELPKEVWEKLSRDKEIHPEDLPSGITLDDVRKAREAYYEKPSRPVLDVLTDARYQHAIILGDPGSGKSTLARYVMLSLIDDLSPRPPSFEGKGELRGLGGHLPLLIELRSYAGLCADDKCNSFLEFLEYLGKTEGWALTQAALHNHLKNDGRAVVIFDGLDEIFDPELRERITRQIVGFCGDYPKARIIVTSRVIGYRRKILTDAGFTHFTLQDLDEKQVETFVSRWYDLAMSDRPDEAKECRERILRSFKESASIRQLAGNPMLLTIMAIIGKHQELPRERWKLYDHATSVLIQHWDVNKHLKDKNIDADFIGEDDKEELLRRLAFRMQGGDGGLAGNYIHRDQLQAEFDSYLRERYAQAPDRAVTIARAMIEQFRERNFILSLYGANVYGFVHRAFLEYFCASAFVYKFEKTKELTIDQLKTDVYGNHWEDQSWHEVLRLICGMIDDKWVDIIINYLSDDISKPWPLTFGENLPWNIAIAVQCVEGIRNLVAIEKSATRLLVTLCDLVNHSAKHEERVLGSFIQTEIIPFVEAVGANWPGREFVTNWLSALISQPGSNENWLILWANSIGRFVGALGKGKPDLRKVLRDIPNDSAYSMIVPSALAIGWHNESSPKSLRTLAYHSKNQFVRREAIHAMSEYYRENYETSEVLVNRALYDDSPLVRNFARSVLSRYFPHEYESINRASLTSRFH